LMLMNVMICVKVRKEENYVVRGRKYILSNS
jgi:hypothetical protein